MMQVQPLTRAIGAEIAGVDLRQPLEASTVAEIRQALLDHLVIFFRDQDLTPDELYRFSEYFGPVMMPVIDTVSDLRLGVTVLDQVEPKDQYANNWHTDHTFVEEPPMASILRAVQVPEFGGDTCFSSMYAAYEALSPSFQRFVDGLTAVHSDRKVRAVVGDGNVVKREDERALSVVHPIVRVHPESGRRALYLSSNYVSEILELNEWESLDVLRFLYNHVKDPSFQCRFHWEVGSIAMWDNRCVLHAAIPDYTSRRVMHRTMIAGDRPVGPSNP